MTRDELFESEGIALNWPLIVEFFAEWLERKGNEAPGMARQPWKLALALREDMGRL